VTVEWLSHSVFALTDPDVRLSRRLGLIVIAVKILVEHTSIR
jgi:hypothetical protein